ncbi:DNA replication licensing factor mcm [Salix suchowensis]|nr:DNA replication licensing factor mcm [Salix suchowensis]
MEKVHRGGSGGAFEALSKVKEGDVVALLNPRILKPFQRSEDTPHPVNNILAITPSSASTILVLGRSKDLGMCMVVKRDGKVCGSWCDKRVSDACEFHVQTAVERRRASRPEFSAGSVVSALHNFTVLTSPSRTSGMSVSAVSKRKPAYDPARQWGLAPVASSSSSVTTFSAPTYVVSGHVVSSNSDNFGREGQAKAQRKLLAHEADQTLKKLLRNDKEGTKAVLVARKAGLEVRKRATSDTKGAQRKGDDKRKAKEIAPKNSEDDSGIDEEMEANHIAKKPAYSARVIKKLGFDPLAKFTQKKQSETVNAKLEALASLQNTRQSKSIELGPRPGPKHRSSVKVPKGESPSAPNLVKPDADVTKPVESGMIDLDDF